MTSQALPPGVGMESATAELAPSVGAAGRCAIVYTLTTPAPVVTSNTIERLLRRVGLLSLAYKNPPLYL